MNKKGLGVLVVAAAIVLVLAGCGKSSSSKETTITVGASEVPHSKILDHIKPELKKEGVNLKVKVFQDYVLPNQALAGKDLDANFFQHVPFLDNWNKQHKGNLVSAGKVHLEPIGFYSNKVKNLKDLKDGAKILVSNNVADYGRILTILKDNGLITLKPGTKIESANFSDIAKNKKHLVIKKGYEPKLMPQLLKNGEGDAVVINANYAVQAGLTPTKDSIAIEKSNSPYANIVAVRKGDENSPAIKKLMTALQSKSTENWIEKEYKGSIIPVK